MNMLDTNVVPLAQREIASYIRTIPDFPKPGIQFKDISPLLAAPHAFRALIESIAADVSKSGADTIVGLEARGFIIGVAVAQHLGLPFVPARKAGKLPGETISVSYALEYGEQKLELQKDAIKPGAKVAVLDDLLATGGTANAAAKLISKLGGDVVGFFFAIELDFLQGRKVLESAPVHATLFY